MSAASPIAESVRTAESGRTTETGQAIDTEHLAEFRDLVDAQYRALRTPIWICAGMLVLYAAYFAKSLVLPMVFALLTYLTLRPLQRKLNRLGIPNTVAAVLLMVTIGAGASAITGLVYNPILELAAEVPESVAQVRGKLAGLARQVESINEVTEEISDGVPSSEELDKPIEVSVKQPTLDANWTLVAGTGSALSFLTISVVVTYFLLAFGDEALKIWLRMLPRLSSKKVLIGSVEDIQDAIGGYLWRVSLINLVLGVAVCIAMHLWGMSYPLAWGVMAATFNFIPILGAIAGAGILFFAALIHFNTATEAALITATFLTLTTIEGQFITPSLLGRAMNVNPLVVAVGLIVFGWLWGFLGVLVSVPLVIAGQLVMRNIRQGEEVRQQPTQSRQDPGSAMLHMPANTNS